MSGRMNWERPKIQPNTRTKLRNVRVEPGVKTCVANFDDIACCDCYWPIERTSMMDMLMVEGERRYRHRLCPSLSERRAARLERMNA